VLFNIIIPTLTQFVLQANNFHLKMWPKHKLRSTFKKLFEIRNYLYFKFYKPNNWE